MIRFVLRCLSVAGLTLAFCPPCPSYAQVYKWTDEKGEVHFDDNPRTITGAREKGSVIIPGKKEPKEPEQEQTPAPEEPAVPPTPDTAREKPADDRPKPVEVVDDPNITTQPAQEKEAAKASNQQQQPPAEKIKMSKRVLKAKKLEKDKSGSEQTASPAAPPATAP
jgi:hypothetical protein